MLLRITKQGVIAISMINIRVWTRQQSNSEHSESSNEPFHPSAKGKKYSSNSPEETHISLVLKFHHLASIKI